MSATILYHMHGVRGYRLVKEKMVKGGMEFHLEVNRGKLCCPECNSTNVWLKGGTKREFRSLPIGWKRTTIILDVPRVSCHDCQCTKQVSISFAKPYKRYTRFFESYVLDLLVSMTCQAVTEHLGVFWSTARDIEKVSLKRHFAKPPLKGVPHIAIDEIAVQKGHKYLTVVMDLKSGRVIFVGDGKSGDALLPFWKRLRRAKANIVAVCSESPAYTKAIATHLPDALHVYDRFHVMKLFNEQLTKLRRQLFIETTDQEGKNALKGIRFSLLKRPENLDEKKEEPKKLQDALNLHADLAVAYALKEQLVELWEADEEQEAMQLLADWIADAEWSQIPEMQAFAKTLRNHWEKILNYHCCEITSGPLEGLNNKIKTLKRQSYGFRDQEYFKLKILAIHRSRYALLE
jgi:Transposase and inactivated derivatives